MGGGGKLSGPISQPESKSVNFSLLLLLSRTQKMYRGDGSSWLWVVLYGTAPDQSFSWRRQARVTTTTAGHVGYLTEETTQIAYFTLAPRADIGPGATAPTRAGAGV